MMSPARGRHGSRGITHHDLPGSAGHILDQPDSSEPLRVTVAVSMSTL